MLYWFFRTNEDEYLKCLVESDFRLDPLFLSVQNTENPVCKQHG